MITRTQMIADLQKMIEHKNITLKDLFVHGRRKSWAYEGTKTRRDRAVDLLTKLQTGGAPSVQEVVGHYGKGARFAEDA